ncbi:MAG TPA: SUMF1/EgtB/PvdO family nonheme iron enzyme, partial [Puia sp.]|nr:SUMF1/EgtB/PvdO family nonheme iron enzyme [Puia sp.]
DIKYILGHNPLFPAYSAQDPTATTSFAQKTAFLSVAAGLYDIGYEGNSQPADRSGVRHESDGFCFDNELSRHKVYLDGYRISDSPVTNEEWLAFMEDGGYRNFAWWHAEGWDWVKNNAVVAPLYWHPINGQWHQYTLSGLQPVDRRQPVCHVSYYEAVAFAAWKGARLPTEQEWEVASGRFEWGQRWEWTESAYLPYPGFKKAAGAIGEYNGKFMVNQMVLRGASVATPPGHSRKSYRNFFQPQLRWQFTGIRLAK